ncbi:MAG TPA: NAD(P)/FAD-dependent oxidoreductase, partial [Ferruginibacter sp.]|nr:NAD(P)/FAD-dependent oxidoreductase [Ferruginibacter sp.]
MTQKNTFDVIIVGGSYSGLSAGMALGRALKKVLIIDGGKPCNRQTPYSHNFITHDGDTPIEIAGLANLQVKKYQTIAFFDGLATNGIKTESGFEIQVASGETFAAKQLIFATGIRDMMPGIDGFADCWGISVLHCPYCHGYEVRNEKTGILANGELDFVWLISNWTKDLTLFTNGISTFTIEQTKRFEKHQIKIVEKEIASLKHINGHLQNIIFRDGKKSALNVMYAPVPFEQHCDIPELLGCQSSDDGYIVIDPFHETTVKGVYACGDNVSRMRTVANAVGMGTTTGMTVSKKMI